MARYFSILDRSITSTDLGSISNVLSFSSINCVDNENAVVKMLSQYSVKFSLKRYLGL